MSENQPQIITNVDAEPKKKKLETAFIQVPVGIKEDVEQYIQDLMAQSDGDLQISDDNINELSSQGCFLVISLEKIEEILNNLKECIMMTPDNGAENIKSILRRTQNLLS